MCGVDLWHFTKSTNPRAYGRASHEQLYGKAADRFQPLSAHSRRQPMHRIWLPFASNSLGPMNGALDSRTEVTYGYNPLELSRYDAYIHAAEKNPRHPSPDYRLRGQSIGSDIPPPLTACFALRSPTSQAGAPRWMGANCRWSPRTTP